MTHIADVLLEPLAWAVLFVAAGLVFRGRERLFLALALAILAVFASPAVANRLAEGLETPLLPTWNPRETYDAVIVLAGTMNGAVTADHGAPAYDASVERVLTAFDLLRSGQAKNALFSGTSWRPGAPEPPAESRLLADQVAQWGIDRSRLLTEERSRNTHENAVESARVVRARGWGKLLLVTSSAHMPRAAGCFRHEGLAFDTLPVDFAAYDSERHRSPWLLRASALHDSSDALREYAGRIVYRWRGWSD